MTEVAEKQERFHFLDGLRGIAALLIVIHHAFTSNIMKVLDHLHVPCVPYFFAYSTQSGVDLFFVLSGVVLLRPYLRKQRKFKVIDYFRRRIKRIYPPYFFALLFSAFVAWFNTTFPTWYNIRGMRVTFSWLETFKEAFIINHDGIYYNLAWWSLQIEIIFYILAPLIIFIFPAREKINNRNMTIAILFTLCSSIFLQFYCTGHFSDFYSLLYNVANAGKFIEYPVCFLMGVLLATKDFSIKHAFAFIASGVILIGCSWYYVPYMHDHYLPLVHPGYGLVYAGVITLSFHLSSFKRFLSKPLMIWLGERSYSLFLIHFSVFYFIDNLVSRFTPDRNALYGILTRAIGVPLAFFMAMLLFHFVERRQARGLVTGNMFWPWQAKSLDI
jgi:peptidoglycan/LPS O-acetylase OafA/YrhL